jgi:hypothetical protein
MKTCGYCGRENEDSASVCRECGQREFPETVDEKARAAQARQIVEPEPELPEPDVVSGEEACLCPFCLFPNLPEREWCKNCGSPFNTSVMGPFESALAEGFMWRGAVRGRPKPIVVLAVWMLCLPTALGSIGAVWMGIASGGLVLTAGGSLYAVVAVVLLYQVTKNFLTLPKPKLDD